MDEGPEFTVEAALNAHVARVEEPRPPDGKWHPSSLYGCSRKAVYELRGVPVSNPPDDRARRVFRVGHMFHDFAQDAVERAIGSLVAKAYREIPIAIPSLSVIGHADGLVQYRTGEWELLEYKSISTMGLKYAKELPKPDHLGQVQTYMLALREDGAPRIDIPPLGDALTRARVAYIGKEDMAISEHIVPWTPEGDQAVRDTVAGVEAYRDTEPALPPRLEPDKGKRNWLCGYCSFATRCWDQDEDNREAL